ncbi:HaeII family restriction endonuclease [Aphanothece hegewaldii CCALA 016]|uniref:HaeII family restriction endonuclease n=1 Tax=Aphanothece hegewaldii CCALA 016 TaxID=2107694 RepID=A0A2T1M210_9CHRO|nr:HaeII family restriction endonuclease [Aphanothece hegewaldii]PSF38754.1 HaeII family restriction endonuclease [Aphanothece hegewaldii CCALA 016]
MSSIQEAKDQLNDVIKKSRVDMYKPIQIAEVLRYSRLNIDKALQITELATYKNKSCKWRDEVTKVLLGKSCTSSANYQHDLWNAVPPESLKLLDTENKRTNGGVERYIYLKFSEKQKTIASIIAYIESTESKKFELSELLQFFKLNPGIKRSIDKAYEIVTYSLFETIIVALETKITVSVPSKKQNLLNEFSDLAKVLLGLQEGHNSWEFAAHIYRVGVTNAADRGLDMWANFGPAIQIKHLTLDTETAKKIIDQIESDHIVIVCRDTDKNIIQTITQQIGWGQRVRGIIQESELISWYDRCLKGKFSNELAKPLLECIANSFRKEFPHSVALADFLEERKYITIIVDSFWTTNNDIDKIKTDQ